MSMSMTQTDTITTTVTFHRGRILIATGDWKGYAVEAEAGLGGRGMLWVEHDDGRPARVMPASEWKGVTGVGV